jgi:hypothetical protein
LIAMKFVLHEDTSCNLSLKFRGGAQIRHYNDGLPLNLIIAMIVDIKYLIWKLFKILIRLKPHKNLKINCDEEHLRKHLFKMNELPHKCQLKQTNIIFYL